MADAQDQDEQAVISDLLPCFAGLSRQVVLVERAADECFDDRLAADVEFRRGLI